ncbi:hypothetical protein [Anabaena azotica]|uniref:IPT/TIG domain-containing protein n=1 Tax=Anabaena azotica FACHB-119 TaxID=947527 RepID=A0ABR8DBZ7_9NOST|nr:hypothetical protein [Anabaena azotica]MBD2504169.1 hypothetical protein [Anabaena azotica FACHB-119]
MTRSKTIFQLRSENGQAFDGSTKGITINTSANVGVLNTGFRFNGGALDIARNIALDNLQTFTIEATIVPEKIAGDRRNLIEAQTPGLALFIDPTGKLVGSINTSAGWISVDSGTTLIESGKTVRLRFLRYDNGQTELQINDTTVGSKVISGSIVNAGTGGFKIGTWVDGKRNPFIGSVITLDIKEGTVTPHFQAQLAIKAQQIATEFQQKTGITRVSVSLIPDEGRSRLQPIRDIMNAAGVKKLSDLASLQIAQPTVMTPGKVIVAPMKSNSLQTDWSNLAKRLATANVTQKQEVIATLLSNRNSETVLKKMQVNAGTQTRLAQKVNIMPDSEDPHPQALNISKSTLSNTNALTNGLITDSGRLSTLGNSITTGTQLSEEQRRESPTLRQQLQTPILAEIFVGDDNKQRLADIVALTEMLQNVNPTLWPTTANPTMQVKSLTTIPVGSAVIIASILDLTNTKLVIEPTVTKLYIIAEEVICGANAQITWRRPGGTTPARADNPDLNGRGWSGVHTFSNSRDGLHGEDGRTGDPGINGARGADAPELEMWVKRLTAIPNLDINGEDGRKGGQGQRGGKGGNGADGQRGERFWFFGWHCTARPGYGGHGGNGGRGGVGGRGGDGGSGGNITIGVLEGTLAATVTNKSFKIKNQGGQKGSGGDGGKGGGRGRGGRAGIGETCKDAQDGRDGGEGASGSSGIEGINRGFDGEIQMFEFSEDAWDELLTRPWISELAPTEAFPGDKLTIRGSKFVSSDRLLLGTVTLVPTINADESISVTIPINTGGGAKSVIIRRADGTQSNQLNVGIKPQITALPNTLSPGVKVDVTGKAFLTGAGILIDGVVVPATFNSSQSLTFTMPNTGGTGSDGGSVSVQVRNPDGRVSNPRIAMKPKILEIPFRYGVHNLKFGNFDDGKPSWKTFEDTFGTAEVWHESLDPVFGHPLLTAAYYKFYEHFLIGETNSGLATGFCTSLASLVADKFWKGETDATTVTKEGMIKFFTAIHGRLLSRESLIHFHDQGREGVQRVELTAREIESTFLRGCDRQNAPLLFFIPSGEVWDAGYIDKLGASHCVMPYKFEYPASHPGPKLSPDGSTTISDLDGVKMFVWDCNRPDKANCRLEFKQEGSVLHFSYFREQETSPQFSSKDGITLGMMTNGNYLLADHSLPFSGPLGLTRFVLDFLLSPADLQITDGLGLRTGNFGGQLLSQIPDSHPCYLVPGMYLLPDKTPLIRRITGTGNGTYTFNSITPSGASIVLEDVQTAPGQEDVFATNNDATQIRFSPGSTKTFNLTIARKVDQQFRAIAVRGMAGAPGEEVDITLSPELSLLRVGNRGAARSLEVRAFSVNEATKIPVNKKFAGVNLPLKHDLLVTVPNWDTLEMNVEALSFS